MLPRSRQTHGPPFFQASALGALVGQGQVIIVKDCGFNPLARTSSTNSAKLLPLPRTLYGLAYHRSRKQQTALHLLSMPTAK